MITWLLRLIRRKRVSAHTGERWEAFPYTFSVDWYASVRHETGDSIPPSQSSDA